MPKKKNKSKLDQISVDAETVEIGGVEFNIEPLTNAEYTRLVRDNEDQANAMVEMVIKTLQKDDPNITRKEFMQKPMVVMSKVFNTVVDVNGLSDFMTAEDREELLKKKA